MVLDKLFPESNVARQMFLCFQKTVVRANVVSINALKINVVGIIVVTTDVVIQTLLEQMWQEPML